MRGRGLDAGDQSRRSDVMMWTEGGYTTETLGNNIESS